tara:strand:+ start:3107 stop:3841 length:735 start_codon:yes stop_codon:yes gene_type:complete
MTKYKKELERLKNDEDYYGSFGKQYLSNSDISKLLTNPLSLREPQESIPAFLVGGYFHTAILEPDKLKKFKIIEASTRNTKIYKEISGGEMCLLKSEVDKLEVMIDTVMSNDVCKNLIRGANVEYEVPGIKEIEGELWKGKADIINHDEKLIIDLKTTADIAKFKYSATKYNYDSQAYVYSKLFGYDLIFIAVDKSTNQIGLFDCSPEFYARGADKVKRAVAQYQLFFKTKDFDPKQFFINRTL